MSYLKEIVYDTLSRIETHSMAEIVRFINSKNQCKTNDRRLSLRTIESIVRDIFALAGKTKYSSSEFTRRLELIKQGLTSDNIDRLRALNCKKSYTINNSSRPLSKQDIDSMNSELLAISEIKKNMKCDKKR